MSYPPLPETSLKKKKLSRSLTPLRKALSLSLSLLLSLSPFSLSIEVEGNVSKTYYSYICCSLQLCCSSVAHYFSKASDLSTEQEKTVPTASKALVAGLLQLAALLQLYCTLLQ